MLRMFRCLETVIIGFLIASCLAVWADPNPAPTYPGQALSLLSDGNILATGGFDKTGAALNDAYLINPSGSVTKLATGLLNARGGHSATVLPDGTVLIFGGKVGLGTYVRTMEIFDPKTARFIAWAGRPLLPRCNHTATLLTDGRVVVIGGIGEGGALPSDIQLWDFRTGSIEAFDIAPIHKRQGHTARLLADGRVFLSGGVDVQGEPVVQNELYDPSSRTFYALPDGSQQPGTLTAFKLSASIPDNGASAFPIQDSLSLRFSQLIDVRTATANSVWLEAADGAEVAGSVVAAENGRIAFFTPEAPLAPGADYILTLDGLTDSRGMRLEEITIHFHTAGEINDGIGDGWVPDSSALAGNWSSGTGKSSWQDLPPMKAKAGITALAGQVLGLSGKPLDHVTLQIEDKTIKSDDTGRFLLSGLSPGHHVLVIDGRSANRPQATYGLYEAGVDIKPSITNILNYTIWMTKLDTADAITIPSPTTAGDTVITSPRLPGLELHLTAGTAIIDREGHRVTQLSVTPIPLDKPPFPLPTGVRIPIYFTIQPGGSEIDVANQSATKGAQLYYPNNYKDAPGTAYNFWNYDAASKGWYIYGSGKVSLDRQKIIPDPSVFVYELTGAMVGSAGGPSIGASQDPTNNEGDPVDLSTGQFVYTKTDLSVSDTIPISFTRTYITNDNVNRPLGIGASDNYDIYLTGDTYPYTYMELVLPNGGRIRFNRVSIGNVFTGAAYLSSSTQGPWYGATIAYGLPGVPGATWILTTKNGTLYGFPDSEFTNNQMYAALIGIVDRYGNAVSLTRNTYAFLTKITSPNGRYISLQYDSSNRITQISDNAGRSVKYAYYSTGEIQNVTDANGGVTTFTYDLSHHMLTIQDARQIVYLANRYDVNGRVQEQTLADGGTYIFQWTPSTNVVQQWTGSSESISRYSSTDFEGYSGLVSQVKVTDPRGYVREATFNNLGMRTSDIFALGQAEQQTRSYRYYADNLLNSEIDTLGRTTSFDYDVFGNATTVTRLAGTGNPVTSTFGYDLTFGNLLFATDPLGNTTTLQYDSRGNLQSILDPLGHSQTFAHNSQGQLTSATDGMNNSTTFGYSGGDLTSITDPLGNRTNFTRDQIGRLTGITDAQAHLTQYALDNLNQVKTVTDALGSGTGFVYDPNGNLLTVTDALNHATNYSYDYMDRVQTRTDPLLRGESYTYDLGGNLATFTDRKGQKSTFTFDGVKRLTTAEFGVQPGSTNQSSITYTYDGGNRMTQAVDSAYGTVTRGFDQLDRLTTEATAQGSIGYTYDNAGRRLTMQVAGQAQVVYGWDNASRLSSITQGTNAVGFNYDDANRRSTLTLPNGIAASYSYDSDSHLRGISYDLGGNHVGDLSYSYDSLGHRGSMTGSLATINLSQPITSASYDGANELTNLDGVTISYDADGNLVNDGIHSYSWDARNQLTSIDSGGSAAFTYDPFGRRSSKTTSGLGTTGFLYDSTNPAQELNGSTPIANLLEGGIDEYFTRADSAGTKDFLTDALGSTLAITDVNGIPQTQYTYDPFGSTTQSGTTTTSSYAYAGRELDVAGLYFNRTRYYSPAVGRFLSEDPAGFAGSGPNFYAYADDDPTDFNDPFGMDSTGSAALDNFFDFVGGAWSTATFGLTDYINKKLGFPDLYNKCNGWYKAGSLAGIAATTAAGGFAGAEAGGARAGEAGFEFSHWIPARMGGPRSIFNGNYVSQEFHYLTDPFRYPSGWRAFGPKLNSALQQALRIPWVYDGAAAGAAAGTASAMAGRSCGCQ
jgi:RHS repeat-associated protein